MSDLDGRLRMVLEQAAEATPAVAPVDDVLRRGRRHQRVRRSIQLVAVAGVTVGIVLAALLIPGSSPAPRPLGPSPAAPASPRSRAAAEAHRLLRQATLPPRAVALPSPPSQAAATTGLMMPAVDTVVTVSRYWRVPMPAPAALAWLSAHRPIGLTPFSSSTGGVQGNPSYGAVGYSEPPPPGLEDPQLQQVVMPIDDRASLVRVDAIVIWLDPRPMRDDAAGLRLRVTRHGGCPTTDAHMVGVTNAGTDLDRSLLPSGQPVGGLICDYVGMNGKANSLLRATRLDADSARRLAAVVDTISLAHTNGGFRSCGMDEGAYSVLVFAYPQRPDVDLWWARGGCQPVSNGHIVSTAGASERGGISVAVNNAERAGTRSVSG